MGSWSSVDVLIMTVDMFFLSLYNYLNGLIYLFFKKKGVMNPRDIKVAITWSQTGLTFLSYAHMILVVAWAMGGLLDGFSNGILHVPPLAYEIILVKLISDTIGFGLSITGQSFVVATKMKHRMIVLVGVLLVIGIALNITHLVFTAIELSQCTSLLCNNNYWFLFVFAFILSFIILFEAILLWYFVKYNRYVKLFQSFLNKKLTNP